MPRKTALKERTTIKQPRLFLPNNHELPTSIQWGVGPPKPLPISAGMLVVLILPRLWGSFNVWKTWGSSSPSHSLILATNVSIPKSGAVVCSSAPRSRASF